MYPYGESAGDTELSFTNRCPRINVPGGGIRFFSTRFRELYVSVILASIEIFIPEIARFLILLLYQ